MDLLEIFFANFFQVLLNLVPQPTEHPYATGRMASGITYYNSPEEIGVSIVALDDFGEDYVIDVNEGLNAKKQHRKMSYWELENYHFIQRAIDQAAHLISDRVIWEGGQEFEIH